MGHSVLGLCSPFLKASSSNPIRFNRVSSFISSVWFLNFLLMAKPMQSIMGLLYFQAITAWSLLALTLTMGFGTATDAVSFLAGTSESLRGIKCNFSVEGKTVSSGRRLYSEEVDGKRILI